MFFALKGLHFNGNIYAEAAIAKGAKYAIVDEAKFRTSSQTILVKNVLQTLQLLATFHREQLKTPIIAITGSNGKTTTKELIAVVLAKKYRVTATKGNLNNHIGVPLTLLSITKETEIAIVEMGANHQKEIEFLCKIAKPDFGYITNFGKAHLEGFGGVEGVVKGKSEMYEYLILNHKLIFINANDPVQIEKTQDANVYTFGSNINNCDVQTLLINANPFVHCCYNALEIKSQLIGAYNFNNISIAITMGKFFKVSNTNIKQAIEAYTPTNNRSQIIEKNSNKIILDAYNANPSSMEVALLNLKEQIGHKIAILGDMFELGKEAPKEHQYIADLAVSLNLSQVIFIGENFYPCNTTTDRVQLFRSFNDFKNQCNICFKNHIILIKGSRGMALERVMELI